MVWDSPGGTLFLDEIGDLLVALQVKLLRVLQECQVVRLGSRKPIPLDIRLIAATNVELRRAVEAQHFRADLRAITWKDIPSLAAEPAYEDWVRDSDLANRYPMPDGYQGTKWKEWASDIEQGAPEEGLPPSGDDPTTPSEPQRACLPAPRRSARHGP